MVKSRVYHDVAIVRPDVFALGGDGVFKHFQRRQDGAPNLLVLTPGVLRDLEKMSEKRAGVSAAVRYLAHHRDFPQGRTDNISWGRISTGLDVAILHEVEGDETSQGYKPSSLVERVLDYVQVNADQKPLFMTNNAVDIVALSALGLRVERPEFLLVDSRVVDRGIVSGNDDLYARLQESDEKEIGILAASEVLGIDLGPNQFIKFMGKRSRNQYAKVHADITRASNGRITDLQNVRVKLLGSGEYSKELHIGSHNMHNVLGVKPLDMEQYLALQYGLLDRDVEVFFLCGSQGSGKTLLSYAAAVDQILWYDKNVRELRYGESCFKGAPYDHIILLKPNEVLGGKRRDVGALPGNLFQKLKPHLEPYIDAHRETDLYQTLPFEEMLRHPKFPNDFFPTERKIEKVNGGRLPPHSEAIQMTYSGFMRGRSFRRALVLIDEAQNLEPYEMKTIFERLGPGCKVIVMGDPKQVDNPNCSPEINGLTHAVAHYMGQPETGIVSLSRNYRSAASDHARSWKIFS